MIILPIFDHFRSHFGTPAAPGPNFENNLSSVFFIRTYNVLGHAFHTGKKNHKCNISSGLDHNTGVYAEQSILDAAKIGLVDHF